MPRKKGIAESRKGKRKPPPKPQEKAKASTMPDDTASEHESTASGGDSPVDELDGMAADVRPVRKAAHEAMKRLEKAVDDVEETHDEYMYEEAMYNFSKTCISATTRSRAPWGGGDQRGRPPGGEQGRPPECHSTARTHGDVHLMHAHDRVSYT